MKKIASYFMFLSMFQKIRVGFTLVELLISVGVLLLLATFFVPTFQLLIAQQQLDSAAGAVAGYIRLTQQKTVTEQKLYGLSFLKGARVVTQYQYNPVDQEKIMVEVYDLPTNIEIAEVNFLGQNDIRFSTAGSPDYSGSLVIRDTIRNQNKSIYIKPSGLINSN